ncbi:hypothetical protein E0H73_23135 [Kribbella pittospori]|uniref:Uncharacterized protein n=1 Tax=Kribbella pittospori TaxID=722689 RepID=A0A4R0KHF1_9ACTN|nr:hypothetical protein [Kribbella pittospori]TCC59529.1 hypothetical protein E0H73_23135 [Kribbella pittospori]
MTGFTHSRASLISLTDAGLVELRRARSRSPRAPVKHSEVEAEALTAADAQVVHPDPPGIDFPGGS